MSNSDRLLPYKFYTQIVKDHELIQHTQNKNRPPTR
jgi:hypothetical protein